MRLIDADDLIERAKLCDKERVRCMINSCNTVDAVEVVHGLWIEQEDGWGDTYYDCSVCGNSWTTIDGTPFQNGMNYCPNCGAKMDLDGKRMEAWNRRADNG